MVVVALGTFTWIPVVVIAAVLAVAVVKVVRSKQDKDAGSAQDLLDPHDATIEDAKVGDVVTILGFDPDIDGKELLVEKRNRYESGGAEWFELLGVLHGSQVWIDLEVDDALRITVTSPERMIELAQLKTTEEDLASMDDEESKDRFIEWNGRKYFYVKSCMVGYFKDCTGPGEGFYLWEFESEDKDSMLSIERWGGRDFNVYVSKIIDPDHVKLFQR